MELNWKTNPSVKSSTAQGTITIPAGKTLKIETSAQGEEILQEIVPAGKVWTVHISVFVEERDA